MNDQTCEASGCEERFAVDPQSHRRFCSERCRTAAKRARLSGTGGEYTPARAARPDHPKGWVPRVEMEGSEGTIVTPPTEGASPDFEAAFKSFELDPDEYEILEPVNFRTWQMWADGELKTMRYFKANVRRRQSQTSRLAPASSR